MSQWLYKHLTEAGPTTVLMETRQVKGALNAMPIKTDRRDALGIAQLLRMGWFRPVHCKPVSSQEIRALLATRKTLQGGAIAIELSMRGLLRGFGLKIGLVSKRLLDARARELAEGNSTLIVLVTSMLRSRACVPAICGTSSGSSLAGLTNPRSMVGQVCSFTSSNWFRTSGKRPSWR